MILKWKFYLWDLLDQFLLCVDVHLQPLAQLLLVFQLHLFQLLTDKNCHFTAREISKAVHRSSVCYQIIWLLADISFLDCRLWLRNIFVDQGLSYPPCWTGWAVARTPCPTAACVSPSLACVGKHEVDTQQCWLRERVKKKLFFWEISPKCVYPVGNTHPPT